MLSSVLLSSNVHDTHVLQMALEQFGIDSISVEISFNNLNKVIQTRSDVYIIELPYECELEMKLIRMIHSNPLHKSDVILAYGPDDIREKSHLVDFSLIHSYFEKPLQLNRVFEVLREAFPDKCEELDECAHPLNDTGNISLIKDKHVPTEVKLKIISSHAGHLLAFPFTLPKVHAVANSHGSGASELAAAIETDPVIAAHILRTANSVFYSSIDHKIVKMQDAVVRIGFDETKRIVFCMEAMKLIEDKRRSAGFNRVLFWYHSIAVAVATEVIFTHRGNHTLTEQGFLCGLFHDFGTIVLDEFLPTLFDEILLQTVSSASSFTDTFLSETNFSPNSITSHLLETWQFPAILVEGISFRSLTNEDLETVSTVTELKVALNIAHTLIKSLGLGRSCDLYIEDVPAQYLSYIGLENGVTDALVTDIFTRIKEICRMLHIAQETDPDTFIKRYCSYTISPKIIYYSLEEEKFSPFWYHVKSLRYESTRILSLSSMENYEEHVRVLIISVSEESDIASLIDPENPLHSKPFTKLLLCSSPDEIKGKLPDHSDLMVIPRKMDIRLLNRIIDAAIKKNESNS